jgi:transposase-like protein
VTTLVPAAKTYTQQQKDEALALYETRGPTAVEKQLGIPKNTVAGWARKTGTRTVRTAKTNAATDAKQADDKAVRAMIASDGLNVARMAADLIRERLLTEAHDIPVKDLATLYGIFMDKHVVLAKLDQGNDTTATDSVVDQLLEGFKRQAGQ